MLPYWLGAREFLERFSRNLGLSEHTEDITKILRLIIIIFLTISVSQITRKISAEWKELEEKVCTQASKGNQSPCII